jgi:hypothetical protein
MDSQCLEDIIIYCVIHVRSSQTCNSRARVANTTPTLVLLTQQNWAFLKTGWVAEIYRIESSYHRGLRMACWTLQFDCRQLKVRPKLQPASPFIAARIPSLADYVASWGISNGTKPLQIQRSPTRPGPIPPQHRTSLL